MSATATQFFAEPPGSTSAWFQIQKQARRFLQIHEEIDARTKDSATDQLELARQHEAPASKWLADAWSAAEGSNREADWNALPEDVSDLVEEGAELVDDDLSFLLHVATNPRDGAGRTDSAIRLLGLLADEVPPIRERAVPVLLDSLEHPHPRVRYRAAEALWTAGLSQGQDRIARAAARENDEQVRATLEHLLSLFR